MLRPVSLGLLLFLLSGCGSSDDSTSSSNPGSDASVWRSDAKLPAALTDTAAVSVNGTIVVVGGWDGAADSSRTLVYDPTADAWSDGPDLPQPRHAIALAVVGGDVYAVGGLTDADSTPVDSAWVWRAGGSSWEPISSLLITRGAAFAAAIGKDIFVLGGSREPGKLNGDVVAYDTTANNWTVASTFPTPRAHLTGFVFGDKAFALGGVTLDPETPNDKVEIFDPSTTTWSNGPALPSPRSSAAAVLVENRAVVVGGATDTALDAVDVLDVGAGSWAAGPTLPSPRVGAAVAAAGGRVYVIGLGRGPDRQRRVVRALKVRRLRSGCSSSAPARAGGPTHRSARSRSSSARPFPRSRARKPGACWVPGRTSRGRSCARCS
jgi:N-acetylneuraminic acid mutarotase